MPLGRRRARGRGSAGGGRAGRAQSWAASGGPCERSLLLCAALGSRSDSRAGRLTHELHGRQSPAGSFQLNARKNVLIMYKMEPVALETEAPDTVRAGDPPAGPGFSILTLIFSNFFLFQRLHHWLQHQSTCHKPGLNTIYFLRGLGASRLRSRCGQGWFLLRPLLRLPWFAGDLWPPLACGSTTPISACIFTLHSPCVCVSLRPSFPLL